MIWVSIFRIYHLGIVIRKRDVPRLDLVNYENTNIFPNVMMLNEKEAEYSCTPLHPENKHKVNNFHEEKLFSISFNKFTEYLPSTYSTDIKIQSMQTFHIYKLGTK